MAMQSVHHNTGLGYPVLDVRKFPFRLSYPDSAVRSITSSAMIHDDCTERLAHFFLHSRYALK